MTKKVIEVSFVVLLVLFSFYYTDKAINVVEQNDPIMQQIDKVKETFAEEAVNASVEGTYVKPGYNGLEIDTKKSFEKMKKYGSYSDNLLVFKEVIPTISVNEYYDKYISSGNGFTNLVAFVFKVEEGTDIKEVKTILDQNNVRGTFFVDGKWVDRQQEQIYELAKDFHEVEVLSYDKQYDPLLFQGTLDKVQLITNVKGQYCYAEYDQLEVLKLCSKEQMHTIIPTMKINSNLYSSLKGAVRGGDIVSIAINRDNVKELPVAINYLKQRGYTMDTLDNLLNEGRNLEK